MGEEKKGFFGKLQDKYAAHKEAVEQKKLEKIEDEKKKAIDELATMMNNSLKDIVATPIELKPTTIGAMFGVTCGFTTTDNTPVVSYITIESSTYKGFVEEVQAYPLIFMFGSYVDRSVPVSMMAKKISTGFARSERVLIPFQAQPNLQFDAKTIWKNRANWDPLVETLNKDKRIISTLSSLSNEAAIRLSSKRMRTYKIEDQNETSLECMCQIVPYKNMTLIGLRSLGLSHKMQLMDVINLLRDIREQILSYGHTAPVNGYVAQDWIKVLTFVMTNYFAPIKQEFSST
jgi:hypothetical protein